MQLGNSTNSIITGIDLDVNNQWNVSFYMVSCILEQQHTLCATLFELHKAKLLPHQLEFN